MQGGVKFLWGEGVLFGGRVEFVLGDGDFELLSEELNLTGAFPPFEEEGLNFYSNMDFNDLCFLKILEKLIRIWPHMSFVIIRHWFLM